MAGTWSDIARESRRASAINQIARATAWEYLSNPRPTDLSRVPPTPESLTPEFLTAILCKDHPGAAVTGIKLGAASSGSGDRCAFTVTYNEAGRAAGLPNHLFHKGLTSFYTRVHNLRCGIVENEPSFYNLVRPELSFEAPRAHYAAVEPVTRALCIILDDVIHDKGATFYEVATPVERSDAEQMMAILGETHGRYWESERLTGEFGWLIDPLEFSRNLIEGMELEQLTANGFERAASVLPEGMAARAGEVWSAFLADRKLATEGPLTYIVGDPHLRNFYKTADGVVGLADWQVTMRGSWSHDFAYTLITALPIGKRREWERDLLAYYLDRVRAAGGNPPAFDEAWERYRRQTMYTFVGWLVTIGFGALQPDMQPADESLEIIRRAAVAVDDHDSLALLNG